MNIGHCHISHCPKKENLRTTMKIFLLSSVTKVNYINLTFTQSNLQTDRHTDTHTDGQLNLSFRLFLIIYYWLKNHQTFKYLGYLL